MTSGPPDIRRVDQIDWQTWVVQERATLLFVLKDDRILLIRKKRGLGAGKINGPGGRIEEGETPMQCAIRETQEELKITPLNVTAAGDLRFHSDDFPRIHGFVFVATDYTGTATETDEAIPVWTPLDEIPYEEMWSDDIYWLPQVIAGKCVDGRFVFQGETLLDYQVVESSR
jgi:8-oxo-dGTP diphosphatase|tara:strand:- start:283 stop:798 length:516 start_codon:yes stop_codon:yes gene_type:complete